MISIYHYVNKNDFEKHINHLLRTKKIVTIEEYLKKPEGSHVLTFDDGLKEQYLNAFPILKRKKLPAYFFPLTEPLENKVPYVFKQHIMLKINSEADRNKINKSLKPFQSIIAKIPQSVKDRVLNSFIKKENNICKSMFLEVKEMREMVEGGMIFGNHTHSHPFLSRLSSSKQFNEIKKSKNILEKELKTKINIFAYPYGDYNNLTLEILDTLMYRYAFASNVKPNSNNFTIPREDILLGVEE